MAETIKHIADQIGRVRHQCRRMSIRRCAYNGIAAHARTGYGCGNRRPKPFASANGKGALSGKAQLSKVAFPNEDALIEVAVALNNHRLVEQLRQQGFLFPRGVLHLIQED